MTNYSGSSSTEYNNAEIEVLQWLNHFLSEREKKEIKIIHKSPYAYMDGRTFELDGLGSHYAVEIYLASDLRGSKIDKIASDILKLSLLPEDMNKIIICTDAIRDKLMSKSWISYAIHKHRIELLVPELSLETKSLLLEANIRNRNSVFKSFS